MSVYLGGRNVAVAEHHLHRPQVGAMAEQMGGKRMADHMRGDVFVDAGGQGNFANDLPEAQSGHAAAASGDKKVITVLAFEDMRATRLQILIDFFLCLFAKGNQPFLVALAQYPDKTSAQITGSQRQLHQLRHPQAGGVENKEHGVVSLGNWC